MVVAIVYNTAWYIYNFRRNLIKELQSAGHTVIAICPHDEFVPKLEALGVKHFPFTLEGISVNPFTEIRSVFNLFTLFRKIKPDCALSFTVKCNLYTGLCRRFTPFKHIANISGLGQAFDKPSVLRLIVAGMYRLGLRKTSAIFFQNGEDLELCRRHNLVPSEKCHLLPGSGVDLTFFSPETTDSPQRRTFLMFGRLLPKKGYDDFLSAAKQLKRKYGPSVEFQIMGVEDERRLESRELAKRVQQAEQAGVVRVVPRTQDVRPVLGNCDVVVLPSTYNEGIPRSLLEALACAKPIITTNWKGCRETVVEGVNGNLIPINDTAALVHSLETYINMSPDDIQNQGLASRKLAEKRFDEGLVINTYMKHVAA